jgi:hypothetical protein
MRRRFLIGYALVFLVLAAEGVVAWRVLADRPKPALAPGAVALVKRFATAVQEGDLRTACRLFSALPSCSAGVAAPTLRTFHVYPAQAAVDGYDVPAVLDGQYALFSIADDRGVYRIVDVVADPVRVRLPQAP